MMPYINAQQTEAGHRGCESTRLVAISLLPANPALALRLQSPRFVGTAGEIG